MLRYLWNYTSVNLHILMSDRKTSVLSKVVMALKQFYCFLSATDLPSTVSTSSRMGQHPTNVKGPVNNTHLDFGMLAAYIACLHQQNLN